MRRGGGKVGFGGLGGGRRWGSAVLLLAAALLVLRPWEAGLWPLPGGGGDARPPARARGKVVRAIDGDTLEVRLDRSGALEDVRLIGVDTPETVKPGTPVQCYGPRASAFEHRVAEGRRVRLLVGVEPRDAYDRLLAYVYLLPRDRLSDNPKRGSQRERFLNAELVRRGLARTLEFPPNIRFAERFAALQQDAARAGRGLWGRC
ncbi:MAG TPA: thermonuclease family protein [Solirubrobacterales bacterium]|jgi:micrococcal nuclease